MCVATYRLSASWFSPPSPVSAMHSRMSVHVTSCSSATAATGDPAPTAAPSPRTRPADTVLALPPAGLPPATALLPGLGLGSRPGSPGVLGPAPAPGPRAGLAPTTAARAGLAPTTAPRAGLGPVDPPAPRPDPDTLSAAVPTLGLRGGREEGLAPPGGCAGRTRRYTATCVPPPPPDPRVADSRP